MTEPLDGRAPAARIRRQLWGPKLVWLVPLVAAAVGLTILVNHLRDSGPRITISFQSGEGIEVGKTLIKLRNVNVGRVFAMTLSQDQTTVLVTADLFKDGESAARADSKFWVVRPRVGIGWASGLDTLVSGSYIGVNTGRSTVKARHFIGLENPPPLSHALTGKKIDLTSTSVGSIGVGAPVYFHQFQVGRVIDLNLLPSGEASIVVFVDSPYDRFITSRTRFWNASGIDAQIGTDGLKLKTESVASILAGGIAFDSAPNEDSTHPVLTLFKDQTTAMARPNEPPMYIQFRFTNAVRGLSVDAPVEFRGVTIGAVSAIELGYDENPQAFPIIVTARVFPTRMGRAHRSMLQKGVTADDEAMTAFMERLVMRGLRAQAKSASVVSGSLFIALDFIPGAGKSAFNSTLRPLEIPTLPSNADDIENRIASIARKIDALPLGAIFDHLDDDLQELHGTLALLSTQLIPEATVTIKSINQTLGTTDQAISTDSPGGQTLGTTLSEAQRTLAAVRELSEYLNRHPEALIRGRQKEPRLPK